MPDDEVELLTCDVDLLDDATAIARIRDAVVAAEPFSMVRVNDGEAVALEFGDEMWLQDVAYLQSHWGGEGVSLADVALIRDDLQRAIDDADLVGTRGDIIGVPVPADLLSRPGEAVRSFVTTEFPLRPHERDSLSVGGARRIALLQRAIATRRPTPHQQYCSCWLHWEMLASGALVEILSSVDRVGLVTARPEIEHLMRRRFGIEATTVLVPDKFVEAHRAGAHVPTRYRTIRSDFRFPAGSLVLVGAGIPGKAYCHWLKQIGCVAIDIGAVFDAWVGKASRPRVLESRFSVHDGARVPHELQLTAEPVAGDRALVPRWKAARSRT